MSGDSTAVRAVIVIKSTDRKKSNSYKHCENDHLGFSRIYLMVESVTFNHGV